MIQKKTFKICILTFLIICRHKKIEPTKDRLWLREAGGGRLEAAEVGGASGAPAPRRTAPAARVRP